VTLDAGRYPRRSMEQPASSPGRRLAGTTRAAKRARQRAMREVAARHLVTSQHEFVDLLAERGFTVTQATVSRDIMELGLVKVVRGDRHVYASPEDVAIGSHGSDAALRRLLDDHPMTIRRSGLTLLLVSTPGMAAAFAQAIDDSSLQEQEGTLAGDNTVLVLFADEERLLRWREQIDRIRASSPLTMQRPEGGA
jgi:transcriptional regulator of arginine metabolism